MKICSPKKTRCRSGLTLVELAMVVAILGLLGLLFLASQANRGGRAVRLKCVSNLKNIGLAFRVFATDNNDQYPMSLSFTNGGTREWIDDPAKVWTHYRAVSKVFSVPEILICPTDREGRVAGNYFTNHVEPLVLPRVATNFETATSYRPSRDDQQILLSRNQNVSYFVGVAGTEEKPQMFLAGDRHLTNREPVRFAYGQASVGNLGTNHLNFTNSVGAGWDRRMHDGVGNVCQTDGSVQQYTSARLRDALRNSGDDYNRVAVPD